MPIVPEYATALAQFKAGNIYSMGSGRNTPKMRPEDILADQEGRAAPQIYPERPRRRRRRAWASAVCGKSPFLDERVRQAFSMSIDRDLYMDTFLNVAKFQSEGLPVETRWNTGLAATFDGWWLDPKGKNFGPNAKYYKHDIAEAKKLLAAAGYATA